MNKTITFLILGSILLLGLFGCEREVVERIIVTETAEGDCFVCHGDEGLLLQAKGEWQNSLHASGTNVDYTNRGGSDCTQCHNHQGFLEYLSTGSVSAPYDNVSSIHCFTCHAPHEREDLSLRIDAPFTLYDGTVYDYGAGNLCVNCHHSRRGPEDITDDYVVTSTHWGPHNGPQGEMLAGTNGYEFSGYDYGNTNHAYANNNSCVNCHMGDPRTHSGYGVGGHSFNIRDDEGNTISGVCANCHDGVKSIDFLADFDYDGNGEIEGYQTEIDGMLETLGDLLYTIGVVDANHHPIKMTIADGNVAGAVWNLIYVEKDQSHGSHNFGYTQGLLQSSIDYINSLSGGSPPRVELLTAH